MINIEAFISDISFEPIISESNLFGFGPLFLSSSIYGSFFRILHGTGYFWYLSSLFSVSVGLWSFIFSNFFQNEAKGMPVALGWIFWMTILGSNLTDWNQTSGLMSVKLKWFFHRTYLLWSLVIWIVGVSNKTHAIVIFDLRPCLPLMWNKGLVSLFGDLELTYRMLWF